MSRTATASGSADAPGAQETLSERPPATPGAGTEVQGKSTGPTITFYKTVHDCGQVSPRSRNVCEFTFQNTGTDTLIVRRKMDSTCGCTAATLAKTEYAPGEEGLIKVTYSASTIGATVKKYMTVHSNDKKNPQVRLTIAAKIVPRVACEPKQLDLSLKDKACPPITVRSLDGTAFSVRAIMCTGNSISADFDPSVKATEFTIQPKVDLEKLQRLPSGYLALSLTHPECKQVTIRYKARSGFQFIPASLMLYNVEPNMPLQRTVQLSNSDGQDFEIESLWSERNLVDVLAKTKAAPRGNEGARYRLRVSIKPPISGDDKGIFADTLSVRLTNGQTLKLNCHGFYATPEAAASPYPPP